MLQWSWWAIRYSDLHEGMRRQDWSLRQKEIIQQLTIYFSPNATTSNEEKRRTVLSMLQAYGRSSDDESPFSLRQSGALFSYLVLCFPELQQNIASINETEYNFKELPKIFHYRHKSKLNEAANYYYTSKSLKAYEKICNILSCPLLDSRI